MERKSPETSDVQELKIVSPAIWRQFAVLQPSVQPSVRLRGWSSVKRPTLISPLTSDQPTAATLSSPPPRAFHRRRRRRRRRRGQRSGGAQLSLIYVMNVRRTTTTCQVPRASPRPLQAADVTARLVQLQVCNYQWVSSNRLQPLTRCIHHRRSQDFSEEGCAVTRRHTNTKMGTFFH